MRSQGKNCPGSVRPGWQRVRVGLSALLILCVYNAASVIIQTVGWTYMMVDFAQQGPVKDAIVMTFNGDHPCRLCKLSQALAVTDTARESQSYAPVSHNEFSVFIGNSSTACVRELTSEGGVSAPTLLRSIADPAPPLARPG